MVVVVATPDNILPELITKTIHILKMISPVQHDVPLTDDSQAKIISYTPNEVILETHFEHAGFLVFSDAFHPEWQVFANGPKTKLYRVDYLIRGVFFEEGFSKMKFKFKPTSFYLGAI